MVEGKIFSLAEDNAWIDKCTMSGKLFNDIIVFSLAPNTRISPETYFQEKIWLVLTGEASVGVRNKEIKIRTGELFIVEKDVPVSIETNTGAVYLEIEMKEEYRMNDILKAGEVFALKDLLPVQPGKVVNMDLVSDEAMHMALMSFDAGTGLSEHAAPAQAVVFALEGEAVITYEGVPHTIKAGENFVFAKNGKHAVEAKTPFKMALLLIK